VRIVSNQLHRIVFSLLTLSITAVVSSQEIAVRVPPGFKIERVAGDDLATNIYSMTTNERGEVFAAGPGYIRRLNDDDGDGVFESATLFSNLPRSGAMGLFCEGESILAVGDDGIWKFDDADRDGVADAAPQRMIKVGTGGEHFAHAIRRGVDGWLYCLCGNSTPVPSEFSNQKFSPVKQPRAGFLMRVSPDYQTVEVVAHGFRNAYDFDFNSSGETFVYDSDGERDISLPWYRGTRVFLIQAGDDAGWVSHSWKRPSYYFDMPKELADFGRGSPTGVVCYRDVLNGRYDNSHFPDEYRDALFVADWTFGKIRVLKRDAKTGEYDRGNDFAVAEGQFGFAVTDLAVAKDGSLLFSVGGRGLSGAVYRISCTRPETWKQANSVPPQQDLDANGNRILNWRLREHYYSRADWNDENTNEMLRSLTNSNQEVSLAGLESLIGRVGALNLEHQETFKLLIKGLMKNLNSFDPQGMKLCNGIVRHFGPVNEANLIEVIGEKGLCLDGLLVLAHLNPQVRYLAVSEGAALFDEKIHAANGNYLTIIRLFQTFFDENDARNVPELFRGYTASFDLTPYWSRQPKESDRIFNDDVQWFERPQEEIDQLVDSWSFTLAREIAIAAKHDNRDIAIELGRTAALLDLSNNSRLLVEQKSSQLDKLKSLGKLQTTMLDQITAKSSPVEDIHWLICLARTGTLIDEANTKRVASALVELDRKLIDRKLPTDRNWAPRMRELTHQLFKNSLGIAAETAQQIKGRDGQLFLVAELPEPFREEAVAKFAAVIQLDFENATSGQLRVVAGSQNLSRQDVELLRTASRFGHLKDVAILALTTAKIPAEQRIKDRPLFVEGLQSRNVAVVKSAALALRSLPTGESDQANEVLFAYQAAVRMGWDRPGVAVRDAVMQLLLERTGESFGYEYQKIGLDQSEVLQKWREFVQTRFPTEFEAIIQPKQVGDFAETLSQVDWSKGDAARGKLLYTRLKCAECHSGNRAIGPSLAGLTKRFGTTDLMRSIAFPSEQIPDRYQATIIATVDGQLFTGAVIYESVDGITLQTTDGETVRINRDDIEAQKVSAKSLMPDGLLDGVAPAEWADLVVFLKEF